MIRNDGHLLFEDPDITATGSIPPCDSLIFLFPQLDIDARLYVWEVHERNEGGIYRPADPVGIYSFEIVSTMNQVVVTPRSPRDNAVDIQLHGHLLGDHRLLPTGNTPAEHKGLITSIEYDRDVGDTLDFTTYDWVLYRWRPEESREFIREDSTNYSITKAVDKVTVTLATSTTSWIATYLLGFSPSSSGGGGSGRYCEKLIGTKNGINTVFTTSQTFTRATGGEELVFWNGVKQTEGASCDYTVSESGGAGTGYDTITMAVAPLSDENLDICYVASP